MKPTVPVAREDRTGAGTRATRGEPKADAETAGLGESAAAAPVAPEDKGTEPGRSNSAAPAAPTDGGGDSARGAQNHRTRRNGVKNTRRESRRTGSSSCRARRQWDSAGSARMNGASSARSAQRRVTMANPGRGTGVSG
jgi:hypothetical protein